MAKIAIIPARGGSKRIVKKNIKCFLGKPIIAYSIESAINSGLFDEVMVSTDDDEIAKIAKQYGAVVPFFRSTKNSNDFATTIDVIEEVIGEYKKQGREFTYASCIYPCAPFVTYERLLESFGKLEKYDYDCVFPIVRFSFPIQRAVKINAKGVIEMFQPKYMQTRSQDLEPSYHDVGQFYFFKIDKIIEARKLWTDNTGFIELSELESQDIDHISDWELAEMKYKIIKGK
ncbi:pseudaminic acid cytidylyltransferase [Polaribacter sp. KT 15]|uniref:pseudaminic acid cytidylyltransferase n=1 Tax=Polaribacter sp. KT 15 TaxID=1896175 RepID=UPI0009095A0D|nr:pseudaminic acid cytidylyltransferase [Polaribacter sp. KT 15]SHN00843.1 N-acylneuraminate cytidylyltransferase [Polaribacter sp. KT 15]